MSGPERGEPILFRYGGRSMWPCFQAGDILAVRRVPADELRRGDCIVFRDRTGENRVIHRIVSIRPDIRTRGDNRPIADDEPVHPGTIEGRVVERVRFGGTARVAGGVLGRLAGRAWRWAALLDPERDARGGELARRLRRLAGRWRRLVPGRKLRLVRFTSGANATAHYLLRGRGIVGCFDRHRRRWSVVWPASLCIDPDDLPLPD